MNTLVKWSNTSCLLSGLVCLSIFWLWSGCKPQDGRESRQEVEVLTYSYSYSDSLLFVLSGGDIIWLDCFVDTSGQSPNVVIPQKGIDWTYNRKKDLKLKLELIGKDLSNKPHLGLFRVLYISNNEVKFLLEDIQVGDTIETALDGFRVMHSMIKNKKTR